MTDIVLFLVDGLKALIGFGLLAGFIMLVAGIVNRGGRR